MASWWFDPEPDQSGASGMAYRNILAATQLGAADSVVREVLQNSCDAIVDEMDFRVGIRVRHYVGDDKALMLENLQLDKGFFEHASNAKDDPNAIGLAAALDRLQDDVEPLPCLYFEDYGTMGLRGSEFEKQAPSHYRMFVFGMGSTAKLGSEASTGGSYGYGKSVLSNASKLGLIAIYTEVDPSASPRSEQSARLTCCCYFPGHTCDGEVYLGRGFMGIPRGTANEVPHAIYDDEARELARALGFERRPGEIGTSVLIVDCHISAEDIKLALETWWWPRLEEGKLDVTVVNENDRELHPRPKQRPDLRPFLEAYSLRTAEEPIQTVDQFAYNSRKLRGEDLEMGTVCARVVRDDSEDLDDKILGDRSGTVALVRNPRMVVKYERPFPRSKYAFAGVYIASTDLDSILKNSEPPAHDQWSEESERLQDGDKKAVKGVFVRIKRIGTWLQSLRPQAPERTDRDPILDHILGPLIGDLARSSPVGPPQTKDPFSVRHKQELLSGGETLLRRDSLSIALRDDSEVNDTDLYVSFSVNYCRDADSRSEPVPLQSQIVGLTPVEAQIGTSEDNGSLCIRLVKGTSVQFDLETRVDDDLGKTALQLRIAALEEAVL